MHNVLHAGGSINKLQNSVILLVLKIFKKNPKYMFYRKFNSEYQLWVLLWLRHCGVFINIKYGDVAVKGIP